MIPISSCINVDLSCALGLTESGGLLLSKDGGRWAAFDFNALYAGYYPACRFTAIAFCGGLFYAAGLAEDGLPYVFASLMGGVWEPVNLIPVSAAGGAARPAGKVVRILYEETDSQIFLICDNGDLVTLPDCPRCVKVRRVADTPVTDGRIDADRGEIVLACADGTERRVLLKSAVQYRASAEYLIRQFGSKSTLVNVSDAESDPISLTRCVTVPFEELAAWLDVLPRGTPIAFCCTYGTRADKAAEHARGNGFAHAYSLGGVWEAADDIKTYAQYLSAQQMEMTAMGHPKTDSLNDNAR